MWLWYYARQRDFYFIHENLEEKINNHHLSVNINMRQAAESSNKKKQAFITSIENLPKELLVEILARVGTSSLVDLFSAKLSCKVFKKAAEDKCIYQRVALELDRFPLVSWKYLNENKRAFLTRCEECQNPEIMYRQAVLDYFSGKGTESGLECLERAVSSGHIGAMYVKSIVLIFSGNNESKETGIKWLAHMKNCRSRGLKVQREKLISMLKFIWLNNPLLMFRPVCCTREDNHRRRGGWSIDEEEVYCEACAADTEIGLFHNIFPRP
ncbi:hypothetical protein CDL12_15990 [Handroanthus impetiginosus]|uniref:F-box domain-containing protein n=1 Tax=Handroanthus impetiginosus TaxID=429701 RepID=A0A2G9H1K4_9LAMI|nr:hypothetical protein CDL12_15990 [Handroanthus impetiginosus]